MARWIACVHIHKDVSSPHIPPPNLHSIIIKITPPVAHHTTPPQASTAASPPTGPSWSSPSSCSSPSLFSSSFSPPKNQTQLLLLQLLYSLCVCAPPKNQKQQPLLLQLLYSVCASCIFLGGLLGGVWVGGGGKGKGSQGAARAEEQKEQGLRARSDWLAFVLFDLFVYLFIYFI